MKKAFAALLSTILGVFGFAVVDRALDERVAKLEAEVSSLAALHTTIVYPTETNFSTAATTTTTTTTKSTTTTIRHTYPPVTTITTTIDPSKRPDD